MENTDSHKFHEPPNQSNGSAINGEHAKTDQLMISPSKPAESQEEKMKRDMIDEMQCPPVLHNSNSTNHSVPAKANAPAHYSINCLTPANLNLSLDALISKARKGDTEKEGKMRSSIEAIVDEEVCIASLSLKVARF